MNDLKFEMKATFLWSLSQRKCVHRSIISVPCRGPKWPTSGPQKLKSHRMSMFLKNLWPYSRNMQWYHSLLKCPGNIQGKYHKKTKNQFEITDNFLPFHKSFCVFQPLNRFCWKWYYLSRSLPWKIIVDGSKSNCFLKFVNF